MASTSESEAEQVAGGETGGTPDATPATSPQSPPGKSKGGAPRGNSNAATHLLHSKKRRKDLNDKHRRAAEHEARGMVKEAGWHRSPSGRAWARGWTRLEGAARRLEERLDARGWMNARGEMKGDAWRFLETVKSQMNELRRTFEEMKARPNDAGAAYLVFVARPPGGGPPPAFEEAYETAEDFRRAHGRDPVAAEKVPVSHAVDFAELSHVGSAAGVQPHPMPASAEPPPPARSSSVGPVAQPVAEQKAVEPVRPAVEPAHGIPDEAWIHLA